MKVICAGLSKTGTKSIAKALRILRYNVYDFEEHLRLHAQEWLDAYETDKAPDFYSMYKDVDAVTDGPPNVFFKEILEAFPDSKVILMVRDDEEIWARSAKNHLREEKCFALIPYRMACCLSPTSSRVLRLVDCNFDSTLGMKKAEVTYVLKKRYRDHNAFVKSVVPADKLLVYNVKQGWAPLCKFLDCEVPSCPFPRENVNATFIREVVFSWEKTKDIWTEAATRLAVIVGVLGVCVYFAMKVLS